MGDAGHGGGAGRAPTPKSGGARSRRRTGDGVLGAANVDDVGVPEPSELRFDREVNRHLAFGGGIHRCLGSHLARLELRVALREWHRRIPEYGETGRRAALHRRDPDDRLLPDAPRSPSAPWTARATRPRRERLRLLASAIAGRPLEVVATASGEHAWTDGSAVFVDAGRGARADPRRSPCRRRSSQPEAWSRRRARLGRRPALARRYLAVEGHRALAAIESLLPPSVRSLIDPTRGRAPTRRRRPWRCRAAGGDRRPAGELRSHPRHAASSTASRADASAVAPTGPATRCWPTRRADGLDEETTTARAADLFSSPVGGGGALGRLLERCCVVGASGGGRPSGRRRADPPGRATGGRGNTRCGAPEIRGERAPSHPGTKYPEWDVHRRRYRPDWCTVQEVEPRPEDPTPLACPTARLAPPARPPRRRASIATTGSRRETTSTSMRPSRHGSR